jgi:hypothetical protein
MAATRTKKIIIWDKSAGPTRAGQDSNCLGKTYSGTVKKLAPFFQTIERVFILGENETNPRQAFIEERSALLCADPNLFQPGNALLGFSLAFRPRVQEFA